VLRPLVPALALLVLAACGATPVARGPVEPRAVILYQKTLTVGMSDRSLCVGLRNTQAPVWSGTLQGCPHRWAYTARLPPGRVARLPLVPGQGGAAGATLTGPDGRPRSFTAPR
jgi:hypothetical protein